MANHFAFNCLTIYKESIYQTLSKYFFLAIKIWFSLVSVPCMFPVLFIAPVPTPPTSYRTEDTSGSDHGTTVHVNIPSAGSVRDGIPQTAAEQAELAVRIGTAFHHFILFLFSYVWMVLTINWMNVSHVCRYCIFSPCCCFKGELLFDLYVKFYWREAILFCMQIFTKRLLVAFCCLVYKHNWSEEQMFKKYFLNQCWTKWHSVVWM